MPEACDCPVVRVAGVPGHPSTDRYVKQHTDACTAARHIDVLSRAAVAPAPAENNEEDAA